jgi:3-isopropylmalate dehydrogenase
MLDTLGEEKAAADIDRAVAQVVKRDVRSLTAGKMGYSTSQVGDLVVNYLMEK